MADEAKPPARPAGLTESERRAARRAEQLRANLRRRKEAPTDSRPDKQPAAK